MRGYRWSVILGAAAAVIACAHASSSPAPIPEIRAPLGATLTAGARTGPTVPLRTDPNAKVILSSAADLPPASYLPSQAARGQQMFDMTCGTCHEPGQLIGQGFVESWKDRRVYDLYALIRSTMPLDRPGGLKDGEYLDVVAYLLQANHAPGGTDSLRADTLALRKTRIAVKLP